jgi:hypothetical protein
MPTTEHDHQYGPVEVSTYLLDITLTNETEGHRFSQWTEPIEDWLLRPDGTPDSGRIYRVMRSEYGRCQSSIYVCSADGARKRVGWFFVSKQTYADYHSTDTYLRGAWVTIARELEPAKDRTLAYVAL